MVGAYLEVRKGIAELGDRPMMTIAVQSSDSNTGKFKCGAGEKLVNHYIEGDHRNEGC